MPAADVLGGFEARLSWTDPAPGVAVILTLIIYPSNVGTIAGLLTCDQASAGGERAQTYTQQWDARYEPTEVDLYVHAFWRCSGDWESEERHPFRLEVYQLPGYPTPTSTTSPLLVVEGDAPVGDAMSGMRPADSPVVARVTVTPADTGAGNSGTTTTGSDSGQIPGSGGTATTVPQPPGADSGDPGENGSRPWDTMFPGSAPGWTKSAVAIFILFVTLLLLAAGLSLKQAVAGALLARAGDFSEPPTARETAVLAQDVREALAPERTVTVESPVQPRSSPDPGAAPADFMLQPGQPYVLVGGEGAGPSDWVQVRQGNNTGWVHRATVHDWSPEVVVVPLPPGPGAYRETVHFPQDFDVRDPAGGSYTRRPAGQYLLGRPGADGFRPVYGPDGTLVGSLPADEAPEATLTRGAAPPPPPAP